VSIEFGINFSIRNILIDLVNSLELIILVSFGKSSRIWSKSFDFSDWSLTA
jgi:hypothetical protein